jgi:hypothetical protein
MENNQQYGLVKEVEMVYNYRYLMHINWLTIFGEKEIKI